MSGTDESLPQISEVMDPFQNRRLSEVVAQILEFSADDDMDSTVKDNSDDVYDGVKTENYIAFVDYKEEPRNKDIIRGSLRTIEEDGSLNSLVTTPSVDSIQFIDEPICSSRLDINQCGLASDLNSQRTDCVHYNTTLTENGMETVFGIQPVTPDLSPRKHRPKGELGGSMRNLDLAETPCYRWSVTSV
ncbi:hypothetical protein DPMN_030434 [Dreissena polymorpha]|uniref:Uncharacterized protein n=1 Tax=Dreissena polymorpha TaxID=45954 RepID=A0A9D4LZ11_DREPO|nr:hypothetical protein DPMN_030434 [Dreissena polymorpha]